MDIEKYLDNFVKWTKNPSLDAMKYFMEVYGNFGDQMKFIHIAGTNGKGSCVELISNVLINQGYKVGKYISPHLDRYNERISINREEISDEEIKMLIRKLELVVKKYKGEYGKNITLFEFETMMALLYFYYKNPDFVILETGLGGLYDCTNVIGCPLISIITSIGYDHMDILGNTLVEIAYQKAGIIKDNSNTILFENSEDIDQIFINIAKMKANELKIIKKCEISNYYIDGRCQYFDYDRYKKMAIQLKGKKQVCNAVICIECMKVLNKLGYYVSDDNIRLGLKMTINKGRMETLNQKPLMIYDGAHNEPAIRNFLETVKTCYGNFKRIYIVSILKRKDYKKILKILMEDINAEFIFTSGNINESFISKEELYLEATNHKTNQLFYKIDLYEAIDFVIKYKKDYAIFFIGSFYVYGDVVKIINKFTKN